MDYIKQQITDIDKKIEESKALLSDPELADLAKMEIDKLEKQKMELQTSVSTPMASHHSMASDSSESGINPNITTLEIRSAAGGDEAGIFAGEMLRMYERFAANSGWRIEEIYRSEGKLSQIK